MLASRICRLKVVLKTKRPDPVLYPSTVPSKIFAKPRMPSPLADNINEVFEELETKFENKSNLENLKQSLPYTIDRTQVGQSLPVYVEIVKGKTLYRTIVKKISGDLKSFANDLSTLIPKERIFLKTTSNHLEIKGHYVQVIKKWLTLKGF